MGLLKKLINLFFGKKKVSVKVSLSNAKKMLDEERHRKNIKKELQGIVSEIRAEVAEARKALAALENELPDVEEGPFKKIVQTSKKGFMSSVKPLIDKVEPPSEYDVKKIKEYYGAATAAIQRSIFKSRRNIAYASVGVPKSMRQIGRCLESISDNLSALGKTIESRGLLFSDDLDSKISEVESCQEKIAAFELQLKDLGERNSVIEGKINSLKAQLNALLESEEAKKALSLQEELERLQKRKAEIKERLVSDFLSIRRLLRKFESACKKGSYNISYEQMKTLEKMIKDIDILLKSDPKGSSVKAVLGEVAGAIEKGTLKIDDGEKKQQVPILEKLLKEDFFSNIFWPINEADARILQIERELKANTIGVQISENRSEVSRLERELKEILLEIEKTKSNLLILNKELENKKEVLSKMLSEALRQNIVLR